MSENEIKGILGNYARPSLDDGNRYNAVVLVEDLGHAELLAQNALDPVFF